MDSITLDFSDASFNQEDVNTFIIEEADMVYMAEDGSTTPVGDANIGVSASYDKDDDGVTTISAAQISIPETFSEIFRIRVR